jgi:hypothetical protein
MRINSFFVLRPLKTMSSVTRFALIPAVALWISPLAAAGPVPLCPKVITTLVVTWRFGRPIDHLRRLEIRSCQPGVVENLQLAAWEPGSRTPSLVVETYDYTVEELVMRGKVSVIETGRDAYHTVLVVVFEKGGARLALKETVRTLAKIETSSEAVKVTVTHLNEKQDTYVYGTP